MPSTIGPAAAEVCALDRYAGIVHAPAPLGKAGTIFKAMNKGRGKRERIPALPLREAIRVSSTPPPVKREFLEPQVVVGFLGHMPHMRPSFTHPRPVI